MRKEHDEKLFSRKKANQKTEQPTKGKKQTKRTNNMNVDFEFESFFGFNPRTKETKKNFGDKNKKSPMDMTNVFESFFKVKRD